MATKQGTVRMGPISLFALIILICLSVMAVLTISTAQATYASASKQQLFTTATYQNETEAQELVKLIDETLLPLRQSGGSPEQALSSIERVLPTGALIEEDSVYARYVDDDGRSLTVAITINDDLTYSITRWQATTQWNQEPSTDENLLWTGA